MKPPRPEPDLDGNDVAVKLQLALNKDLARQLRGTRGYLRKMLKVFEYLTQGYGYGWKGHLHEDGCPGVFLAPDEREPFGDCCCDGDYAATEIEATVAVVRALLNGCQPPVVKRRPHPNTRGKHEDER